MSKYELCIDLLHTTNSCDVVNPMADSLSPVVLSNPKDVNVYYLLADVTRQYELREKKS